MPRGLDSLLGGWTSALLPFGGERLSFQPSVRDAKKGPSRSTPGSITVACNIGVVLRQGQRRVILFAARSPPLTGPRQISPWQAAFGTSGATLSVDLDT